MRKSILPAFILSLLLLLSLVADASAAVVNAERFLLPNGLTVMHSENRSLPIVMVTMIVKASQVDVPAEKSGLADLTASLLREGTTQRNSQEISELVDFLGASLGASAGKDYSTAGLAVLKKDVATGFELLSDIVRNPVFPQEEVERTKLRIKGLLRRQEEDPSFLAERAFIREVFGTHPYGRLVQGTQETIDSIERKHIVDFHSAYFLPNNSILSVSGDITRAELIALLERYFGMWQKKPVPETESPPIAPEKTKQVVTLHRDLTQATLLLGHVGVRRDNPDYYALTVMNYVLGGGGFSSRLMQSVRDRMGLVYDIHSFFSAFREGGAFRIGLQTSNESANTALEEVLRQLDKMRQEGVSEQELSDAKSYLIGSFPRRLDTNRKIADFLATVEFYDLGIDYAEKYPEYIQSVTREDVLRVAKKYLLNEDYVLVMVADLEKAKLKQPSAEEIGEKQ
jgi:zinc protease